MFNALVNGQDRDKPRPGEPAVVQQVLKVTQDGRAAVGVGEHAIYEIRPRKVKLFFVETFGGVTQKRIGIGAEEIGDG